VLTEEKLDEIGGRSTHTTEIAEMPCARYQHLEIVSSHFYEAA
jgi:hypothetical protein